MTTLASGQTARIPGRAIFFIRRRLSRNTSLTSGGHSSALGLAAFLIISAISNLSRASNDGGGIFFPSFISDKIPARGEVSGNRLDCSVTEPPEARVANPPCKRADGC